jgi:hypothetical protein
MAAVSHDYLMVATLPAAVGSDAVRRALGRPIAAGVDDWGDDDLLVWGEAVEGEARARAERMFGIEVTASLVLRHLGTDERRAVADTVRAAAGLSTLPGAHAVLFEEVDRDGILLRVDDGTTTLNPEWPGWLEWPDLVDVVPPPYRFATLDVTR